MSTLLRIFFSFSLLHSVDLFWTGVEYTTNSLKASFSPFRILQIIPLLFCSTVHTQLFRDFGVLLGVHHSKPDVFVLQDLSCKLGGDNKRFNNSDFYDINLDQNKYFAYEKKTKIK